MGFAQTNTTGTAPILGTMQAVPDSMKKVSDKKPELKGSDKDTTTEPDKKDKGTNSTSDTAPVLQTTTPKEEE